MSKLEIKNISIVTGDKEVVRDTSFTISTSKIHVLMGPNGSGKSSLVNALLGHPRYTITKGTVRFGKKNISTLKPHEKARLGLFLSMQQIPHIDGITLIYFLHRAYQDLSGKRIPIMEFYNKTLESISAFGIPETLLKRPLNADLSGGEKKQSEIIQLLMLEPKFAFLDEIDSGVDVDSLKKVYKGITWLQKQGTGFMLITHSPDILKKIKPDVVHIMKDGSIEKSGSTELVQQIVKQGFV